MLTAAAATRTGDDLHSTRASVVLSPQNSCLIRTDRQTDSQTENVPSENQSINQSVNLLSRTRLCPPPPLVLHSFDPSTRGCRCSGRSVRDLHGHCSLFLALSPPSSSCSVIHSLTQKNCCAPHTITQSHNSLPALSLSPFVVF